MPGPRPTASPPREATLTRTMTEEHLNPLGTVHGAFVVMLAEDAAGERTLRWGPPASSSSRWTRTSGRAPRPRRRRPQRGDH
ncbi:hypothetical protein RB200_34705 [Streptomyces sp. PmtG]